MAYSIANYNKAGIHTGRCGLLNQASAWTSQQLHRVAKNLQGETSEVLGDATTSIGR